MSTPSSFDQGAQRPLPPVSQPLVALSPQRCPLNVGTQLLHARFRVQGRDFSLCRSDWMELPAMRRAGVNSKPKLSRSPPV